MKTFAQHVWASLIEARPSVQLIFFLRYSAGALLRPAQEPVHAGNFAAGAAGWVCCTVAVYVYNGIADQKEDSANGSRRPIASGRLPVRPAVVITLGFVTIGALLLVPLGAAATAIMALYLLVGYAYSGPPFPLKKKFYISSLAGASLGILTYLEGCVASHHQPGREFIVFAAVMSLWMGGVGGIAKDLSDVTGDRIAGRRSWPIVLGETRARHLLALAAAVVAIGFGLTAALVTTRLLWCAGAIALGAALVASASVFLSAPGNRPRLPYRAFMWTQQGVHAALLGTMAALLPT